jgi:PKD repeat protein
MHFTIRNLIHIILISFLVFILTTGRLNAQVPLKVLYIGNSYTGVNNLPQLIHDVALSAGDTLVFDSNTPGGYQLIDHSTDSVTLSKIMAGGWNYVVLQGQSQEPITYSSQFFSGGALLYNLIKQYNPCAVPLMYMTWGRKNGDAANCPFFPVMCTYEGMDTTLRNSYLGLTTALNGEVSPVSVVWNYIRQNYPGIELYQPDESHPSTAGSYAAACSFYSSIFKKDPTLINFDFGLNASDAAVIRNVAKALVFDSLQSWDFKKLPIADFRFETGSGVNEMIFYPNNHGVQQTYFWNFGDGDTSTSQIVTHSYAANGTYTVTLTTTNCDLQGMHTSTTDTVIQFCSHTPTVYTSHPWLCNSDTLWTQPADSYQWFLYGTPLPVTNQYLLNNLNGLSGFSVMSTVNGCTELSELYTDTPVWSGYYFDAMGDPCVGDTIAFAVLHINGSLSGSENILWYKNDTLLQQMTDEDTLFIATPGLYECRVINPNSDCPLDTTWYQLLIECSTVGVENVKHDLIWNIYPNPAAETITISLTASFENEQIQIYNSLGRVTKVIKVFGTTTIDIADFPKGMYFIRLKNSKAVLKFIKE